MRILLTGANGYIGMRLLPFLVELGHEVICCVRDAKRLHVPNSCKNYVQIIEIDFLKDYDWTTFPLDYEVAYYLIHSMTSRIGNFENEERHTAEQFVEYVNLSSCKQIIYLSGLGDDENLSPHLQSRRNVEEVIKTAKVPHTILRAGIIVGSGSASFEIVRDLSEKLPVMITPQWVNTKCQPIAVRNVLHYLSKIIHIEEAYNQTYDIGGPSVLSYKEMLLQFSEVRGLKRWIYTLPVMTPRLSSYWLYFVTSANYKLAVNLVDSMHLEVVCKDFRIRELIPLNLIEYKLAVELAFIKIEQNSVVSSWKDSFVSSSYNLNINDYIQKPSFGCFEDIRKKKIPASELDRILENIWAIGGDRGWYYADFLWSIRGLLDIVVGGVGLRRGRTHKEKINTGDALDFWRVIVADKKERRLLLYAEMRLPGEAWLEFKIDEEDGVFYLNQHASFRPHGVMGRMYWYTVLPFHFFVFEGMISNIISYRVKEREDIGKKSPSK